MQAHTVRHIFSVLTSMKLLEPQAGGIWVDWQWRAAEGQHLTDDLVLGKVLGSGFQVCPLASAVGSGARHAHLHNLGPQAAASP